MFKLFRRKKQVDQEDSESRIKDFWDKESFLNFVEATFKQHQQDWTERNHKSIKQYTTETFYRHILLLFKTLRSMNRRYVVEDPKVIEMHITSGNNVSGAITVMIQASSNDALIDTETNRPLHKRSSSFIEYWHFKNSDDGWKLNNITQISSSNDNKRQEFKRYAESRGFYYSNDFGWLLLPQEGKLFQKASFKKSSVRNHMLSMQDKTPLQLYHYLPRRTRPKHRYLVAQVELPSSFGRVMGKRHGKYNWFYPRFLHKPRGLKYVSTEGADFNKQYEIYASDPKKAKQLPLTGHHYMQRLLSLSFNVTFEVVEGTLYLYTGENTDKFEPMYILLEEALKEFEAGD